MARPQRNSVDYFPFLCDEGTKMYYIEETYGNDGFATFIKLLRELAKTDFHYLDLSKKTTLMYLSAKCKVSTETLNAIISDLVELDKFDKELWQENQIIWCQDFIDSIQDAYNKRTNICIDKNSLLLLLTSLGVLKQPKGNPKPPKQPSKGTVNPQSIVEEIILDKSKDVIFDKWIEYRQEINKPIKSKQSKDLLIKKFNEYDLSKCNQVVNASIENGWQGLFWDKQFKEDISKQDTRPYLNGGSIPMTSF
jgi:hypothetical protein